MGVLTGTSVQVSFLFAGSTRVQSSNTHAWDVLLSSSKSSTGVLHLHFLPFFVAEIFQEATV